MPVQSTSGNTTPSQTPQDSLMGLGGEVQQAFSQGNHGNHSDADLEALSCDADDCVFHCKAPEGI